MPLRQQASLHLARLTSPANRVLDWAALIYGAALFTYSAYRPWSAAADADITHPVWPWLLLTILIAAGSAR